MFNLRKAIMNKTVSEKAYKKVLFIHSVPEARYYDTFLMLKSDDGG